MKTVVILGGSYGGVSTAHRILKQAAKVSSPVKIILVSPNTHLYWNIAATRALLPGQIADEKIFQAIAPGFKQYPADRFEFIIGSAEGVDVATKKVTVSGATGNSELSYDILILATGSNAKEDIPLKGKGSTEATKESLHVFQNKVKQAKTIYVVGAGPTGVEVAGELGFEYGKTKKITLVIMQRLLEHIASGAQILEGTPASVTKTATKQLLGLNVTIKASTKVSGSAKMPDGRTELTLSSGEKVVTDLYLPTVGLVPNSSYLPSSLVNSFGFVQVDEFLKVKGAKDVWAVGGEITHILPTPDSGTFREICSVLKHASAPSEEAQYVNTEKQSIHVAKNIGLVLKGAQPVKYKVDEKDMLAVPVGRKAGTGHMGSMKLPSFMVNMVKGKTLFMDKLSPLVSGSAF
ncbi:Oxidoreductase ptaL [Lachnellula suecica]|uniref:Oxidoreductase ptaL n=1 Tax=Lachnellula suecica TaxID=602035 RepID=A0A8T9CC13_9HELO|nr:Oxidoreductase ptaL [Lachnellula suecica]